MKYLLSKQHTRTLLRLNAENSLFAFDFDGTLTKIVRAPNKALLSPKTYELLYQLSTGTNCHVAIISGRGLTDLKKRVKLPKIVLMGNHGIEGIPGIQKELTKIRKICSKWRDQLLRTLPPLIRDKNLEVEDKTYSLTIHYRNVLNKSIARRAIQECLPTLIPAPRLIPGKYAVNILPRNNLNKGIAILKLMEKLNTNSAIYFGDDDTDEDVFNLKDSRLIKVRVGKSASSKAEFYLKEQTEMNKVLNLLLSHCQI